MPDVLLAPNNSNHPWPDVLKFQRILNANVLLWKCQGDRLKEDKNRQKVMPKYSNIKAHGNLKCR